TGLHKVMLAEGVVPTVPRGALLPAGSRNFIVAGRCISSDRLANSALRVQATCMATGQAAGAMAALSARGRLDPEALPMGEVHALLRQHGAIVPGDSLSVGPA
ncbi:MAG: FAD-dependent oxidoreductase, partial [Candidatus Latescibacteria bacterium]|nr:FAD-dependent oxidoreductase [Candidatus Latescibacterota bacterium]